MIPGWEEEDAKKFANFCVFSLKKKDFFAGLSANAGAIGC
jgi:hypothetical protein